MGFTHFDLRFAREHALSAPSNNKKNLDRRKFFKSVGIGALALAPVFGSIRKILGAPFDIAPTTAGFVVRRKGAVAWQFPARIFEKGAVAKVETLNDSYHIDAQHISFAGTAQPFSFSADLYNDGLRWIMKFRIPEFGLESEVDFLRWLDGIEELSAEAKTSLVLGSADSGNSLEFGDKFMLGIDRRWNFSFSGKDSVKLQTNHQIFNTDQLLLTYNGKKSQQAGITAPHNALLCIAPAFAGWKEFISNLALADGNTINAFGNHPAVNLLFWTDRAGAVHETLWAAGNNGGLEYSIRNHETEAFKIHRYFILSEIFHHGVAKTYMAASVKNEGQWYANSLGSFLLGSEGDVPDFEAIGTGFKLENYRFAPLLTAFRPKVENAVTLATVSSKPVRLNISKQVSDPADFSLIETPVLPDTIIRKKTTISPVKITPPAQKTEQPVRNIKVEPRKTEPAKETPPPSRQAEPAKREVVKQPAIEIDRDKIVLKPLKLKFRILRPEDMMVLDFEFQNFKLTGTGNETTAELADKTKNGIVTVWFQTQHTLEEAFYEANNVKDDEKNPPSYAAVDIPARHLRAYRSRLVFEYKAGSPSFKLSLEELLNWSKFDLKVHPRAWIKLPAIVELDPSGSLKKVSPLKLRPAPVVSLEKPEKQFSLKIAANSRKVSNRLLIYEERNISKVLTPEISESVKLDNKLENIAKYLNVVEEVPEASTSIEAPALLYISPNQLAGFLHKLRADAKAAPEKTEGLRLQTTDPLSGAKGVISELWHTALGVKLKDGKISNDLPALTTIRALWAYDADKTLENVPGRNQPFMASLDANNRHKLVHTTSNYNITGYKPKAVPVNKLMLTSLGAYIDLHAFFDVPSPADDYLNIIEWQHFATLGRDHYVKVVEEGYLFPFGHKAAIVKITERKFEKTKKAAVNRQRMFIVVIEKEVLYDRSDPGNNFIKFPFQAVRIETASTPDIDNPVDSTVITVAPQSGSNPNKEKVNTAYNFYIRVGGEPFNFDITTTDKEGNEQKIRMPLAFLENFIARHEKYPLEIIKDYNEKQLQLNTVALNKQKVALAESLLDNDTVFETDEISFGAITYPSTGLGSIRFHPVMQWADIYLQQVNQLTGSNDPVKVELVDDSNPGHVFAAVKQGGKVDFTGGADKSGGFLSPNIQITALSRLQGPVGGAIDDISNMIFKASEFFKALDNLPVAKIFGAIEIFSLFADTKSLKGSLDAYISSINNIRKKIEEIKNDLMLLEARALETGENIALQAQKLKDDIAAQVKALLDTLNNSIPRIPNFKTYITEEALNVEYKWIPELESSLIEVFTDILAVRVDNPGNALSVTTRFSKPFEMSKPPVLSTEARFEKFGIQIANMLEVNFNYLKFTGGSSGKSDVKVDLGPGIPLKFIGALEFVNNLQSIIPKTGFSDDGPYIELTTTGVKAGFTISVPNIAVGICMITNISLGAFVNLPFTGDPLTVGFNFCTKENPFMLTISCFGGGGFFQLITRLDGLQSIEAAFEFGAAVSLDVGVASGGVSVMGGFYYSMLLKEKQLTNPDRTIEVSETELTGYLRINGHLSILGLIHISLEFYLCLTAKIENGKVRKLEGSATLKVKVEILFFSKTVSVTVRKQFAGNEGDPTFKEMIEADDWQQYCLAFANE